MTEKGAIKPLPFWGRGLVFLLSLLFFLALLEGSLILIGKFLLDRESVAARGKNPDAVRVLCVGDSYTHGGLDAYEDTYPGRLQKKLNESFGPGSFRVFNQGVCETNTTELLAYLPKVLERYRPHIVLVLVGSANLFNPWDYDVYLHDDWKSRLIGWFHDRRIVQMARLMAMSFEENVVATEALEDEYNFDRTYTRINYIWDKQVRCGFDEDEFIKMFSRSSSQDEGGALVFWQHVREGHVEEALKEGEALLSDPNYKDAENRVLCKMIGMSMDRDDGDGMAKWIHHLLPGKGRLSYDQLRACKERYFRFLGDFHTLNGRYDDAAEAYLRGLKTYPVSEDCFYWLSKVFDRQSRIDARTVVETLKALKVQEEHALDPSPSPFLDLYLPMFEDKQDWERRVKQWLAHDLDMVVRTVHRKSRAKIVFQTYPIEYPLANRALKAAASEHDLPLADQTPVFDALTPKNEYFLDDDHCTPKGHQVMADTVYETLVKERIVAP